MITVTDRIDLGNYEYINLDARYTDPNGNPFSSVSAAQTYHAGKMNELFIGLTVLVKESGWTEAKEYWVQPYDNNGVTAYHLVEKGAGTTDYADLDNKPTISDGGQGSAQIPLTGNVKVTAKAAGSGQTTGVTVTAENGGGITMAFTLEKGAEGKQGKTGETGPQGNDGKSAFEVWKETTGRPTAMEPEYIADLQTKVVRWIPVVYEALSPAPSIGDTVTFSTAPSNPIEGAIVLMPNGSSATAMMMFAVSEDTNTSGTYIYTYIGDLNVDTTGLLGSGDVDGTGLANPSPSQVAKATDVMELAAKLKGVTANETKVTLIEDWHPEGSSSGYYNTNKEWTTSANFVSTRISVDGYKKVRFIGYNKSSTKIAYGFLDADSQPIGDFVKYYNESIQTEGKCELEVIVPAGAAYFVCLRQAWSTNSEYQMFQSSDFYCYLKSGDSAVTQKQLAEVRSAMPVVKSFANKEKNNIVLNEEIVKQLSLDEYEKIDVDVSDFKNGLRYALILSTLKFGTSASSSHACVYLEEGDIVEIIGNTTSEKYFYFLTSLVFGSGIDVPIVEGTEPIYVGQGERVTLQAPAGVKCIAFNNFSTSNPQAITIYRKKHSYTSKVYTADDFIEGNSIDITDSGQVEYSANSKIFVLPVKAGYNYTLSLLDAGTGPKRTTFLRRLPNIGDTSENILGFFLTRETNITTTFKADNDGFIMVRFGSSYTTDNISFHAVKDSVNMSDFVAPMLSKLKFNTPSYSLKSGGIYSPQYNKSGIFTNNSSYKHILLKVATGDVVILKKGTESIRYAFLKDDALADGTLANFVDGTGIILTNNDVLTIVPPTANYLYIQVSYSSMSYLPSYIGILADNTNTNALTDDALTDDMQNRRDYNIAQATSVGLSKLNIQVDENGWELPATLQQLNAQKKAEQLCKIKWTPKHNVPSKISPYYYDANIEQTSIPYSSNNDEGVKKVGIELSIQTFMTAVNNPYSLLYTECINNETKVTNPKNASAWGKMYTKSGNGYAYYGTVCCGLTSSVENSPIVWNNPIINNYIKTNGLYIQICPTGTVDFNLLQIGDVADNTTHSFLVYGLHRDANGNVDKVMISESTSGSGRGKCIIRTDDTREAFVNRVNRSGNPFTLFRYVKLWSNTDYEPSEFVPLTDRGESASEVTYNDAICTFAGDKATFRSDDLVVINYNLNGTQPHDWTKIKVYKDDVLLGEYTLAEAEATLEAFYTEKGEDTSLNGFNRISQHNHALVLGTELAAGMYKACMSDGANDSDFTYWEIIPNAITVVEQGYDSYKVNVSGGFLEAIYVGNAYYLPTYDEQANNEFIIHPIALMQAWGLTYDGIDVKVKLKGKYGSVTTVGATVIEGDAPEPEPEPDDTNP